MNAAHIFPQLSATCNVFKDESKDEAMDYAGNNIIENVRDPSYGIVFKKYSVHNVLTWFEVDFTFTTFF